jgi:ribosomal protein S18 acetylase RimI-like enzyme
MGDWCYNSGIMVAVVARPKTKSSGLRPMEPARDLAGVARLIQMAFADDLDRSGYAALREMRNMSRLGPLLWWLDHASAEFSDLLSGFVWVEGGQIVGNVTVSRAAPGSYRWVISNVAVAEPYRGRGIARALMDAAIELVHEWGGKVIVLQVRDDNASALHIYQTMGFHEIFGTAYLRLERMPAVKPLSLSSTRLRPRHFTLADARMDYELARAATPDKVQAEQPVRLGRYRLGFEYRLVDWTRWLVGGGPTLRLVFEGRDQFEATITAEPGTWWRENRLSLMVHPSLRGQMELALISRALHHLGRWSRRVTLVRHPTYHPQAIEAFKSFGFREERTLLWMKREL